jgi:hypothetical protein
LRLKHKPEDSEPIREWWWHFLKLEDADEQMLGDHFRSRSSPAAAV